MASILDMTKVIAALEAAHASDAGRGFSLVADEITSNNRELQLIGKQILEAMVAWESASGVVRQSMGDLSGSNSRFKTA